MGQSQHHQPRPPAGGSALARFGAGLLLLTTLAGCTLNPAVPEDQLPSAAIELSATPFYPQERYQCGPAALATVLVDSGVETTPDALVDQVWIPEREGSLQLELVAATRRNGRLAYILPPELEAVTGELKAGRPVLVMQNLGTGWWPVWHFAVVIGIDPGSEQVLLRSGTQSRRQMALPRFVRSWALADHWAMVALPPGELPAAPERQRYLQTVADLESTQQAAAAGRAYATWLDNHPDDRLARFGYATTLAAQERNEDAARQYRTLLARHPDDVAALHNLAHIEWALCRPEQARQRLGQARDHLEGVEAPHLEAAIERLASTLAETPDCHE